MPYNGTQIGYIKMRNEDEIRSEPCNPCIISILLGRHISLKLPVLTCLLVSDLMSLQAAPTLFTFIVFSLNRDSLGKRGRIICHVTDTPQLTYLTDELVQCYCENIR